MDHGKNLRIGQMVGMDVYNHRHQCLGEIHDVVLDQDSGTVAYVVISTSGVMGVGNRLYAVPFTVLGHHGEQPWCTLDMATAKVEEAPGFDKSRWPDLDDRKFGDAVNAYFGVMGPGAGGGNTGTDPLSGPFKPDPLV